MTLWQMYTIFRRDRFLARVSAGTLQNYDDTIGKWAQEHADADADAVPALVIDLLKNYAARDIKRSTLSRYYRQVAAFCRFAANEGYCAPISVPGIKEPLPEIRPLAAHEMRRMMACFDRQTFCGLRDYTICQWMVSTGFRRAETVGMRCGDLDLDARQVYVVGKGDKPATVPYPRALTRHLWRYERQAQPRRRCDRFFVSRSGDALRPRALNMMFRRINSRVDLGRNITPHILRHTYAVNALRNGMDGFFLQRLLRHESPDMTQRYLRFTGDDLRDAVDRYVR